MGFINNGARNMSKRKTAITLDNLTAALKTVYGKKIEVVLLFFWHWVKDNYDMSKVTPELREEIERNYLDKYSAAEPLQCDEAISLLDVYGEHFYATTTKEEREAVAIAAGSTPVESEIFSEGFSLRELMQALKFFEGVPEAVLMECFERYARCWHNWKQPITDMPKLLELYRIQPAMKSIERATAILEAFGVELLDFDKPEDLQKWKKVSGVREH